LDLGLNRLDEAGRWLASVLRSRQVTGIHIDELFVVFF